MGLLSTRPFVTSNRASLCKRREKGCSTYSLSCPPPWSSRLCKSSAGIAGAQAATQHAGHDTPSHPERVTLKYEQDLWARACKGLTEVRTILEDIAESE